MNNKFYTKDFLKELPFIKKVGDYSYGNPQILHWGENATLSIGKFCSIADGVKIFLGGNHRTDWITTYPFNQLNDFWPGAGKIKGHPSSNGNVFIGNDVWIGNGAIIMSGVTVSDGAVIGANAVVTKNVLPYAIVAGNPAKLIRKRFSEKEIEMLLDIKWWDWEETKIQQNLETLCSGNIEDLYNEQNKSIFKSFFRKFKL